MAYDPRYPRSWLQIGEWLSPEERASLRRYADACGVDLDRAPAPLVEQVYDAWRRHQPPPPRARA